MKSQMKTIVLALTLTLGVCLFFPAAASAQKGMPCPADPVNEFIMYGNLILCSIDEPGISDLYRFNGIAGQRIEIIASSGTTNPCIELVGVTSACNEYANRNWIDIVLTVTQEYTIRIYDYSSSGTGSYELDLESVVPPSPNARQTAYGGYLTDQINPAGDIEPVFSFTASVGDVVDILAASQTTNPCITLYAPDAKTTWNTCNEYANSNEIRTKALTVAGTYTILVYDYSPNGTGAYSINLNCLGGPCIVTPIPDLSGYLILRGTPLANQLVGIVSPNPGGGQTTTTDQNGYYQFLQVPNGPFTVYAPIRGSVNAASADSVHENPRQ